MVCKEGHYYSLFVGLRYSFASDLLVHEIQSEAEIPLNSSLQSGLLTLTGSFAGLDSLECVLMIVVKNTQRKKIQENSLYTKCQQKKQGQNSYLKKINHEKL